MPYTPRSTSHRTYVSVPEPSSSASRPYNVVSATPQRPERNMLYDANLARLESMAATGRPTSASGVRPRNAVSPGTWATYQQVMRSYNALPVHERATEIQASVRAHLRARIPSHHNGPIVVVLGEQHNTNGSLAQTMAVTQAMSRALNRDASMVYLTEETPEAARESDYEAARAAYKLLDSPGAIHRSPSAGRLDEVEFATLVYPNQNPPRHVRDVLQDACAKLSGFSIGGFDPERDSYQDTGSREAAMVQSVLENASSTGATVVRAGAYHAPALQQALKSAVPNAKVLCICQAADPSPTNAEAINRMASMFNDRDALLLAGSARLEADRLDVAPFVRHAAQRRDLVRQIENDYRTL